MMLRVRLQVQTYGNITLSLHHPVHKLTKEMMELFCVPKHSPSVVRQTGQVPSDSCLLAASGTTPSYSLSVIGQTITGEKDLASCGVGSLGPAENREHSADPFSPTGSL